MLKLLADENFNNDIVRGVRSRDARIDIVRVQDAGLQGAEDPAVLEWAGVESRVLLTHDVKTMPWYAGERMQRGLPMPGLICIGPFLPVGKAIDDLELLAVCSEELEYENQILYLPLD